MRSPLRSAQTAAGFPRWSADLRGVRTAFVTGANRGVGLEITKQLVERGDRVIAACRVPLEAAELRELHQFPSAQLSVIELDVTQDASIRDAVQIVHGITEKIDILLNVAGTKGNLGPDPDKSFSRVLGELESTSMAQIYATNTIGPTLIIQSLLPLLGGAKVINITSSMGSNGLMNRGDWYGYRASKAALNVISHALSFDLREHGTIVIAMHPGWVKTAMGTQDAPHPLRESMISLLAVIDGLTMEDSGKYLNWKGEQLPW